MANEEMIRQQMKETRTSLTDKLETLENQVVQTVQGATDAVNETVENIKESVSDTVSTVKDTFEGTVSAVKDTVSESVATVKEYMDITAYVESHPWLMLGGSVAAGYCLGAFFGGRGEPFKADELARASNGHRAQSARSSSQQRRRSESTAGPSWLSSFGPEIDKLKSLALGALFGTAREMVRESIPGDTGQRLAEVIDNFTTKIGGEPTSPAPGYHVEGEHHESRDEAKMGGTLGAAQRQGPKTLGHFDR